MQKFSSYLFAILCFGLLLTSCQKEESEFIDQTGQNGAINSSSALADLLLGASQNPGSKDNIIDGNSCSQVKYPIRVIANGQELVLGSEADLSQIHAIFDQFPNDSDTLKITFPITVVLQDFSEVVIDDQDDLEDLAEACTGDTEIECVDFVYPITLFTYNTEQEQTGTVVIESDEELYLLFFGLDEEDLISIDFPIEVILEEGTSITVNANQELDDLLALADCDDDEELDDFVEDLTSGSWYITYYFNDYDETDDFRGYEFSFSTDHTAQAANGTNVVPGTWSLIADDTPELDISFGTNAPFDELNHNWEIVEIGSEIIRLRDVSGSDGSVDYLTFEPNPDTSGSNEELNMLIENLTTGAWLVTLFEEEGSNGTSNYAGYEFTFFTNSSVTAVGPAGTINGFWQIEEEEGELDIVLNFDSTSSEHFDDLNDDWRVLESSQNIIRLGDTSGDGETNLLTFEKV